MKCDCICQLDTDHLMQHDAAALKSNFFFALLHWLSFPLLCFLNKKIKMNYQEDFDLTVPPGGDLIVLQGPDSTNPAKPELQKEIQKPKCLAPLDDSRWLEFTQQLSSTVEQWSTHRNLLVPVLVVCGVVLVIIIMIPLLGWADWLPVLGIGGCVLIGLVVAAICKGRSWVQGKNIAMDKRIKELCQDLQAASHGVTVEYHHASPVEVVGVRRYVRNYRYISFAPQKAFAEKEVPTVIGNAEEA